MVRVCCLAADASGGVSDVTKELIEIGLDIKHKHKVCVCDESGRDERFTLTHFGTVTKYALACVWSMDQNDKKEKLIKDDLDNNHKDDKVSEIWGRNTYLYTCKQEHSRDSNYLTKSVWYHYIDRLCNPTPQPSRWVCGEELRYCQSQRALTPTLTNTHTHTQTYTHVHTQTHTHTHKHTLKLTQARAHEHNHTHTSTYTHSHTHTVCVPSVF